MLSTRQNRILKLLVAITIGVGIWLSAAIAIVIGVGWAWFLLESWQDPNQPHLADFIVVMMTLMLPVIAPASLAVATIQGLAAWHRANHLLFRPERADAARAQDRINANQ